MIRNSILKREADSKGKKKTNSYLLWNHLLFSEDLSICKGEKETRLIIWKIQKEINGKNIYFILNHFQSIIFWQQYHLAHSRYWIKFTLSFSVSNIFALQFFLQWLIVVGLKQKSSIIVDYIFFLIRVLTTW